MPTTLIRARRNSPDARASTGPLAFHGDFTTCMPDQDITIVTGGLDVGTSTDVGRVREANEDALLTMAPGDGRLLVAVADGMGGHKAGEVASALAVSALRTSLEGAKASSSADELLTRAVELANRTIWEAAAED